MEITNRDRVLMNSKVVQAWRFMVLNVKILKATELGKQAHQSAKLPHATGVSALHTQIQE